MAHIIELLMTVGVPPHYQEHVMNRLHGLSADELSRVEAELQQAASGAQTYAAAVERWNTACSEIGEDIAHRLHSEAARIEEELEAELARTGKACC